MTHKHMIDAFFDSITGCRYLGIYISGYDHNIVLFKRRKNYLKILAWKMELSFYEMAVEIRSSEADRLDDYRKIFDLENKIRYESTQKLSLYTKVKLAILIKLDLLTRKCKYEVIRGKRILVYKELKDLRI